VALRDIERATIEAAICIVSTSGFQCK
jgi:hypothetical protein